MTLIADFGSAGLVWFLTIICGTGIAGWLPDPVCGTLRRRICVGAMIGMGLMSWMGLLCSLLGMNVASGWPLAVCITFACAAAVVGRQRGVWVRSPRVEVQFEKPLTRWLSRLLIAVCLIPIAAIFVFGQSQPLGNIDGLAIWNFKAKLLLQQSLATTTILHDPTFSYSHQGYPLLVPFQIAYVWFVRGATTDGSAAAWHAILATLFVVFIYDTCRTKLSRLPSVMLTLSVCSMRSFLFQSTGQIADVVLMYGSLASMVMFLEAGKSQRTSDWITCGLCLASLAFVKNEGGAFAGVELTLLVGLALWRVVPWKQAASCFCGYLVPSLPWWIYSRGLPRTDERYTDQLTWQNLLVQSERLPEIMASATGFMIDLTATHGLWLLLAVAFAIAVVRRATRAVWLAFAILAGQLLAYTVAFVITPWDLRTLLAMKMEVILLTAMPALMICVVEVFSANPGSDIAETLTIQRAPSKKAKHGSRTQVNVDWRARVLAIALVLVGLVSLPGTIFGLPSAMMSRLTGKPSSSAEVAFRQELQRVLTQLNQPGDVRFQFPVPSDGRISPDMERFAEMLYYFGNYEAFPRRLRPTSERVVINNGKDLLQAIASAPAEWSGDRLAGTLEVKLHPQRRPEFILTQITNAPDHPAAE